VRYLTGMAVVAFALAGCGDGGNGGGGGGNGTLPGDASSRGAQLVKSSGCGGCHQLGSFGNSGPGPDLTDVGSRLSADEIGEVLVDPKPPMPSFESMPQADRDAIADYLSSLE
jgi:mono/diheme cytochrome c family protein